MCTGQSPRRSVFRPLARGCALALALVSACARPADSPADLLPASPGPVQACGQTLDAQAPPEQVAWALLCVLRQRAEAADRAAAREALSQQCALAHVEYLRSRFQKASRRTPADVDAAILELIDGWLPIVNYYTRFFDRDFEQARSRMNIRRQAPAGDGTRFTGIEVDYALPSEGHGGPAGLSIGVTIRVTLVRTEAGFWRVVRVGYGRSPDLPDPGTEPT